MIRYTEFPGAIIIGYNDKNVKINYTLHNEIKKAYLDCNEIWNVEDIPNLPEKPL